MFSFYDKCKNLYLLLIHHIRNIHLHVCITCIGFAGILIWHAKYILKILLKQTAPEASCSCIAHATGRSCGKAKFPKYSINIAFNEREV